MKRYDVSGEITIRTSLEPGDIGQVVRMHGDFYRKEFNYGISFEVYVAEGLCEFYHQYDPSKDAVWICEHQGIMVGFLLLMHREKAAQLRYFILDPAYRGLGLGKKLMELYMQFLREHHYTTSYLWTTHECEAAAGLYKKHGFRLVEEKPSDAFGKPLREQKYLWESEEVKISLPLHPA